MALVMWWAISKASEICNTVTETGMQTGLFLSSLELEIDMLIRSSGRVFGLLMFIVENNVGMKYGNAFIKGLLARAWTKRTFMGVRDRD